MLDSPGPVVTARLTWAIIDDIEKYEKRVQVDSLAWVGAAKDGQNGAFRPKITFHLKKGASL